jgi:hypothetical protein
MAYTRVPTRTSSDPNASADINQLQTNFDSFLDTAGDFKVSLGASHRIISISAGEWNYPTSDPAPLDRDNGTNGDKFRQLFSDTTEQTLERNITVPYDFDSTGRVVFEIYGYSNTATSNQSTRYKFSHSAIANGESWDTSFATLANEINVSATQDYIDANTFSTLASNLSWTANDKMRIKLTRTAVSSGTTVSGRYSVTEFNLRIPRA